MELRRIRFRVLSLNRTDQVKSPRVCSSTSRAVLERKSPIGVWTIPATLLLNPSHSSQAAQNLSMSRRNRKDVDDLLADLDNLGAEQPTKPSRKSADKAAGSNTGSNDASGAGAKKAPEDAQSLLDDLDSLVQSRAASSSRASQRKKDDAASTPAATTPAAMQAETCTTTTTEPAAAAAMTTEKSELETTFVPASSPSGAGGGWAGWGSSLFSQASKLAEQARQELEKRAPTQAEQARELGNKVGNKGWDLAKGVRGFVKDAGLEKWGKFHLQRSRCDHRSHLLTPNSILMLCLYR